MGSVLVAGVRVGIRGETCVVGMGVWGGAREEIVGDGLEWRLGLWLWGSGWSWG